MSKINTVAEINDLEDGSVIQAFRGRILEVSKVTQSKTYPKKGVPGKKEWRFQHLTVKDKAGDQIDVTLTDREPVPASATGKDITLLAHVIEGKKPAWSGLKAVDHTNRDTQALERVCWVTATAEMVIGKAATQPEPEDNAEPEAPPAETPAAAPKTKPDVIASAGPVMEAKQRLMQCANLMLLCLDAASYVTIKFEEKYSTPENPLQLSADQFQAITSTFFIKCDHAGLTDTLPSTPIIPKAKPAV
jgi:hypothetical protein